MRRVWADPDRHESFPQTMSDFDYYAVAQDLISRLETEGYDANATAILSAMEEGATGTEIFMALRFHVSTIVGKIPLKAESRAPASKLLAALNDALK